MKDRHDVKDGQEEDEREEGGAGERLDSFHFCHSEGLFLYLYIYKMVL